MKKYKIVVVVSLIYVICQTCFAKDSLTVTKKSTFGITYRQCTVALNYERLLHKRFGVGCSILPIYKDIDSNFRVKGCFAEVNARWYFLKMPADEPTSGLYVSIYYLFGYIESQMRFVGSSYNIPLGSFYFNRNNFLFGTYLGWGIKKYFAFKKRMYLDVEIKQQVYQLSNSIPNFEQNGINYSLWHDKEGEAPLWQKYVFTDLSFQFGIGYKF